MPALGERLMERLDGDVEGEHVGLLTFIAELGTTWRSTSPPAGWHFGSTCSPGAPRAQAVIALLEAVTVMPP